MNEQLSHKIQKRINADDITPLPRWRFLLLRGSFWLLTGLSILVGSIAVGTTLFLFADDRRHGLWATPHGVAEFLSMIPFVWLLVLVLCVALGEMSIRHTRQGYRYQLRTIVSLSILLSVIFGSLLNYTGIGRRTHELFRGVPFYRSATYDSRAAWNRPGIGRLAGVVLPAGSDATFSVIDFGGRVWKVRLATSTSGLSVPEASSTVRMSGMFDPASGTFIARSIHVWEREQ